MAEFLLGRIKFVWQGDWSSTATYYKDDVVRYGGKTYICVVGHTAAADFDSDLTVVPSRWNQMSDGQDWKGDWSTSTFYKLNDLVTYGLLQTYVASTYQSGSGTQGTAIVDRVLYPANNSSKKLKSERRMCEPSCNAKPTPTSNFLASSISPDITTRFPSV